MRLFAVPDVYAGQMVWELADYERVLRVWNDWAPTAPDDLSERTAAALRHWDPRRPTGHLPADEVDEARIVAGWVATNVPPQLMLDPAPDPDRLKAFATR
jgi:hypothetical protein